MLWIWLALGLILLAAEAQTNQFYAVFFAVGAFAAALAALANADLLLQVLAAAVIALLGAGLGRSAILQYLAARRGDTDAFPGVTNLSGQRAMTADTVGDDNHPGHVLLAGERWLAISESGEPLYINSAVRIVSVKGTTLVVRREP